MKDEYKGIYNWMEEMSKEAYSTGDFDYSILEDISKYMRDQGIKGNMFQCYYENKWYEVDTVCMPWIWHEYVGGEEFKQVECPIKGWV